MDANSTPDRPGKCTPWREFRSVAGATSVWDAYFDAAGEPQHALPTPMTTNKMRGPLSKQRRKVGEHAIGAIDQCFIGGPARLVRHAWGPLTYRTAAEARHSMLPSLDVPSDHAPVVFDVRVGRAGSCCCS